MVVAAAAGKALTGGGVSSRSTQGGLPVRAAGEPQAAGGRMGYIRPAALVRSSTITAASLSSLAEASSVPLSLQYCLTGRRPDLLGNGTLL
jgi:hypothetical protein